MKDHGRQNSLLPVIGSIIETLRSRRFDPVEEERFREDLETLKRRLTSREYLQTSFKPRNQLSIPERTDEFFRDMRFFFSVGKIWETLFNLHGLKEVKRVLDIGPGFFPKVELGLHYASFNGAVTMLDQDRDAISHAGRFLEFFNCSFSHRPLSASILEVRSGRYDMVVANHFLDDFGLSCHCREHQIDLHEAYLSENLYKALWADINRRPSSALADCSVLARRLASLTAPSGSIMLLDYMSFSHRALNLTAVPRFVSTLRKQLTHELISQGFTARRLLRQVVRCNRLRIGTDNLLCLTKNKRRNAR